MYKLYDFCYEKLANEDLESLSVEKRKEIRDEVEERKKEILLQMCQKESTEKHDIFLNFHKVLMEKKQKNINFILMKKI